METISHWINNQLSTEKSERTGDVYNPATGEVQGEVSLASQEELNAAVASASASCAIGAMVTSHPRVSRRMRSTSIAIKYWFSAMRTRGGDVFMGLPSVRRALWVHP